MEVKEGYTSGTYAARKEIAEYAAKPWVHEIAAKAVDIIGSARPLSEDDIILDYGCGPGVTLQKIFEEVGHRFNSEHSKAGCSSGSSKPFDAVLIDSNPLMIEQADKVKWKQRYNRTVLSFTTSAFKATHTGEPCLSKSFSEILDLSQEPIDVCILSLVIEYLTVSEVEALALKLLAKMSNGGVLALFEWAEHFSYPEEFKSSIPHMRGWPKEKFLRLASRLCSAVENPSRVLEEEKRLDKGLFPSKPRFRLEASVGTFPCTKARTQDCPSGDTINYLIIRKRDA